MKTRLDQFDAERGLDRGRSKAFLAGWYLLKCVFLLSAWPWPMGLKRCLLRTFGAKIGEGVVIKPRVNVHFPWKLEVGDETVLAAGSVVTRNVPANAVVAGNPACGRGVRWPL